MASSGSATTNVAYLGTGALAVQLKLSWSILSQNLTKATSKVRVTLQVVTFDQGKMIGWSNQPWSLKVGGSTVKSGTFNISQASNTTRTLATYDTTIQHDLDGDASISASASVSFNMTFNQWVGAKSVSVSGDLKNIPRRSTPTIDGDTMGQQITITTNRASSTFTHTIKYNFSGHQGVIAENVGASCKWTPELETFAGWCTDATYKKCTIITNTYNASGTLMGTTNVSFNLKVPSSVVPKFTASEVSDSKGYLATYGGFVQGYSSVVVTCTAEAMYGATIKSYEVSLGEAKDSGLKSSYSLGVPNEAGAQSVKLTATDSRGRKITGTKAITVYEYDIMTADFTIDRWDKTTDMQMDESSTVKVVFTGSFYDVGGAGKNSGTALIQYMQGTSGAEWTTAQTVQLDNVFSGGVFLDGFPETQSFMFMVTFTDSFGSTAQKFGFVGDATPVLDIKADGTGVGIFTTADFDGLKVGNQMYIMPAAGNMYSSIYAQGSTDEPREALQLYRDRSVRALGDLFIGEAGYGYGTNLWMVPENGAPRQILNVDKDGYFNLYWRNGKGVGGMVMKTIWEGTWWTGEMTISQQMDYNLFVIKCNYSNVNLIGIRRNFGGTGSRITCFAIQSNAENGNHYTYAFRIMSTSSTTWNIEGGAYCQRHDNGGNHGARTQIAITAVVGVL